MADDTEYSKEMDQALRGSTSTDHNYSGGGILREDGASGAAAMRKRLQKKKAPASPTTRLRDM